MISTNVILNVYFAWFWLRLFILLDISFSVFKVKISSKTDHKQFGINTKENKRIWYANWKQLAMNRN